MFHGRRGHSPLLGPIGGLISLHGLGSEEISLPARSTFKTYLDGSVQEHRGQAQHQRRQWQTNVPSAYPEHVQALRQLDAGLLGRGPFTWYDELAQVTNLLTPAQSMLREDTWSASAGKASLGGGGLTQDKSIYLSAIDGNPDTTVDFFTDIGGRLPVPSRRPLTASFYATGYTAAAGRLEVQEIDPQDALVGAPRVVSVPAGATGERFHLSFTTSVRTVAIRMRAVGLLRTTLPAVTVTRAPLPWAEGRGCQTASVTLSGETVLKAVEHPNGRRIGHAMTIRELG